MWYLLTLPISACLSSQMLGIHLTEWLAWIFIMRIFTSQDVGGADKTEGMTWQKCVQPCDEDQDNGEADLCQEHLPPVDQAPTWSQKGKISLEIRKIIDNEIWH